MPLEAAPDSAIVASFVLTRGAQRAWSAINQQLSRSHGALFWIGGANGTGKTHFLNYIVALGSRAGSIAIEAGRHLVLPIQISGPADVAEIDRTTAGALAHALGSDNRVESVWREMRGVQALRMKLGDAHRQGVQSVAVVIDFGSASSAPAIDYTDAVAEMARSLRHPKLIVVVAAREQAPEGTSVFSVAPESDELMTVAIGRARRLEDAAVRTVEEAYRGVDTGDREAGAIFPLHPAAVAALRTLAGKPGAVAATARMVREIVLQWLENREPRRLVYPAEIMRSAASRAAIEDQLGESGSAALRAAHHAADMGGQRERELASQIADTLMLHEIAGDTPSMTLEELELRLPAMAAGIRAPGLALGQLTEQLAQRSKGAIVLDRRDGTVRFNRRLVEAREIEIFNASLPLIQRFDPAVTAVGELSELTAKLKRLGETMGNALETAHRNRELLAGALRESGRRLSVDQEKTFAEFIGIIEGGPRRLVEAGLDAERREDALRVVASYESLAVIAAAVPRLRAMRAYLDETHLRASLEGDPRDQSSSNLETDCEMLRAATEPSGLTNAARSLEALEARFQVFKWTYVQHYRPAHETWRVEMARLSGVVEDAKRYLDALRRLNSIAALGPAEGEELAAQLAPLARRVVQCGLEGPLSPEITPRCPHCGFVMGTASPREELNDLASQAKRALNDKLASLSQSAIARLIQQHDHSHRLDGFLKITQAAQTDALVRVLDDKLTRYLGRLLEENLADARGAGPEIHSVVRPLRTNLKRGSAGRGQRRTKSLPPGGND